MKKAGLLKLLLNATNVAIAIGNKKGYIKATENKEGRDISNVLCDRIFSAGPFEEIKEIDKISGIGETTLLHMANGVLSNGASLNGTTELNPNFVLNYLLSDQESTGEELNESLFKTFYDNINFLPNELPEISLLNKEKVYDDRKEIETLARTIQEIATGMLQPNCNGIVYKLHDLAKIANKETGIVFNRIVQEFNDAAQKTSITEKINEEEGLIYNERISFSGLKQALNLIDHEDELPNISISKIESLEALKKETEKAIEKIAFLENLFNSNNEDSSAEIFSFNLMRTESELSAVNQVLIHQYRCQLINAQIVVLGGNLLTIASLIEKLAPTFAVFKGIKAYFSNCKKVGVTSCELISFKAYAIQRIGSKIVLQKASSGRLKLGSGAINAIVKSIESLLKDGKMPDSLKKSVGQLLEGKDFSDLVAAFVAGKIGIEILSKFLEKKLKTLIAAAGVKFAAGLTTIALSASLFGLAVATAHMAIAAFTTKMKNYILFCATFKVDACVENMFGFKRKTTYTINLKIRPKDVYDVREGTLRDLIFHPEDLLVSASDILELSGYLIFLKELKKKLKESKSDTEKTSIKHLIKSVEAAIKKLSKAKKSYDKIKDLAAKKGCQAIKASIKTLPKVSGFIECD
jgi:hypothetical protein